MHAIDFPLCLRNFFVKLFQTVFIASIEAVPALSIPYGMMCKSQGCLGRGVCILFQKGTQAHWSWSDGMEPKNLQMC